MTNNNNNQNNISPFTRFLWWIAGASPEILVKYPSEYAKFTAIGMTIAMTCLVAFVSGMAAAWYFSSSLIATLLFGIFWAVLIFCIDRALVVTMKKTGESNGFKDSMKIIIPRAMLAILVAMLMSIPLELIVFEDLINTEIDNYLEHKKEDASRIGYNSTRKDETNRMLSSLERRSKSAENSLVRAENEHAKRENAVRSLENSIQNKRSQLGNPNTGRYNQAYSRQNSLRNNLRSLKHDDPRRKGINSEINAQQRIMSEERANWNSRINSEIRELEGKLSEARQHESEAAASLRKAQDTQATIDESISKNAAMASMIDSTINDKVTTIDSIQRRSNKFILHYSVLEYAVNAKLVEKVPVPVATAEKTKAAADSVAVMSASSSSDEEVQYKEVERMRNPQAFAMLWLIRLLFFIFEMMPTVVKAVAKPGPYERECEAQDKQIASFLASTSYSTHMQAMLSDKLRHEKQMADDLRKAEKDLHDHLLDRIRLAQQEVAVSAINRWKKEQLQNASGFSSRVNSGQSAQMPSGAGIDPVVNGQSAPKSSGVGIDPVVNGAVESNASSVSQKSVSADTDEDVTVYTDNSFN